MSLLLLLLDRACSILVVGSRQRKMSNLHFRLRRSHDSVPLAKPAHTASQNSDVAPRDGDKHGSLNSPTFAVAFARAHHFSRFECGGSINGDPPLDHLRYSS